MFALVSLLAGLLLLGARATAAAPCVADPTTATCASFIYPDANATADLTSLCTSMPFMTGCSAAAMCASSGDNAQALHAGGFCTPMSLVADTCVSDAGMSMMGGCRNYVSMCSNVSVVAQCAANPALPGLPTTDAVNAAVKSICTEMTMTGCEKCSYVGGVTYANCDLLAVYSDLCNAMPTMSQCIIHASMCSSSGPLASTTLCTANSDGFPPPNMLMYFHAGFRDYLLSYTWVANNNGQFVASLIAIFAIAVGSVFLTIVRDLLATLARRRDRIRTPRARLDAALLRFAGTLPSISAAYVVMLVVMSYNIWVFVAAMLGVAVGEAALGWARFEGWAYTAVVGDSEVTKLPLCGTEGERDVVVIKGDGCC
ncbi:Ctr copper transporter family-domain-containing protein [Hyaloraphidium curvatum]|nr:Ctr copper transporter family-domain-containing protein [Hyaloraphidium curvatum]